MAVTNTLHYTAKNQLRSHSLSFFLLFLILLFGLITFNEPSKTNVCHQQYYRLHVHTRTTTCQ